MLGPSSETTICANVRFLPLAELRNVGLSATRSMSGSGSGAYFANRPVADLAIKTLGIISGSRHCGVMHAILISVFIGPAMSGVASAQIRTLALGLACAGMLGIAACSPATEENREEGPLKCALPSDITPSTNTLYCIGNQLFSIPAIGPNAPDGVRVSGISKEHLRPRNTPAGVVFEGEYLFLSVRNTGASPGDSALRFNAISLKAKPTEARLGRDSRTWLESPADQVMSCDPKLFEASSEASISICFAMFYTDAVEVKYLWSGHFVDPNEWKSIDASARQYASDLMVE